MMTTDNTAEINTAEVNFSSDNYRIQFLVNSIAVILILLFVIQSITSLRDKSPTVDEVTYISSGYYMLKTGDFSMNLGHPVHLQMLIAAPLLLLDLDLPEHEEPFFGPAGYSLLESWKYARSFVYGNNEDKAAEIIFLPRLVSIGLAVVFAIFVFIAGKKMYGLIAGLFALFLFVFSPNILANSRLGNLDIGTAFFFFAAICFFIAMLDKPGKQRFFMAGIFLGFCLLTKMTAVYLIPVFFLFIVPIIFGKGQPDVFSLKKRLSNPRIAGILSFLVLYAGLMFVAWFTVCLGYGFQGMFRPLGDHFVQAEANESGDTEIANKSDSSIKTILKSVPVPLPADYFSALKYQIYHSKRGHRSFLLGRHSSQGWWYYYIVAFALKVPVPVLILIVLWLGMVFFQIGLSRLKAEEWHLIIAAAALFFLFSMGKVQIGFRYLLPILSIIYVLLSRLVTLDVLKRKRFSITFGIICFWYLFSSVSVYPHYLAYFNELAGGPDNGYKYLVDSNLDWGQDLKGLKEYMDANDIKSIKLSYFGSADARYYDIKYEYLPSIGLEPDNSGEPWWYEDGYVEDCGPVQGLIAVSATNLQGVLFENRECFKWLEDYEPVARIGHSIFIYDIPAVGEMAAKQLLN